MHIYRPPDRLITHLTTHLVTSEPILVAAPPLQLWQRLEPACNGVAASLASAITASTTSNIALATSATALATSTDTASTDTAAKRLRVEPMDAEAAKATATARRRFGQMFDGRMMQVSPGDTQTGCASDESPPPPSTARLSACSALSECTHARVAALYLVCASKSDSCMHVTALRTHVQVAALYRDAHDLASKEPLFALRPMREPAGVSPPARERHTSYIACLATYVDTPSGATRIVSGSRATNLLACADLPWLSLAFR